MLRRARNHVLVGIALLLGAVLLLSCQPTQPVATPKAGETPGATAKPAAKPVRGSTLRMAMVGNPTTLDGPATNTSGVIHNLYDLLIEPDKDGNVSKEGLFKDWTISSDGKTIPFKLREGVKFHDGTDLDAAAVPRWPRPPTSAEA